jgi:uncharacterized protein with HEPN domain
MTGQTRQQLHNALIACDAITQFLGDASVEEYKGNYGQKLQIERLFEIIGVALHRARNDDADGNLHDALPELDAIIGMRHRIAHGYDKVDDELVWATARDRVPKLRSQLEAILASE